MMDDEVDYTSKNSNLGKKVFFGFGVVFIIAVGIVPAVVLAQLSLITAGFAAGLAILLFGTALSSVYAFKSAQFLKWAGAMIFAGFMGHFMIAAAGLALGPVLLAATAMVLALNICLLPGNLGKYEQGEQAYIKLRGIFLSSLLYGLVMMSVFFGLTFGLHLPIATGAAVAIGLVGIFVGSIVSCIPDFITGYSFDNSLDSFFELGDEQSSSTPNNVHASYSMENNPLYDDVGAPARGEHLYTRPRRFDPFERRWVYTDTSGDAAAGSAPSRGAHGPGGNSGPSVTMIDDTVGGIRQRPAASTTATALVAP